MSFVSWQTGSFTVGANATASNGTLGTTVDPANTWLLWNVKGGDDRADEAAFMIYLNAGGTDITLERKSSTDTGIVIEWMLIEDTLITNQHFATSATGSSTRKSATITAVDLAYSVIQYDGYKSTSSSSFGNNELPTLKYGSTTQVDAVFSVSPPNSVVRGQAIEFDSSLISSIQFVDEATFAENTTGTTSTITSVDTSKTLIFGSQRTGSSPLRSRGAAALSLTSSTVLDIAAFSSSSSASSFVSAFICEFANGSIIHKSAAQTGLTDTVAYGSTPTYPASMVNGGMQRASALANTDDVDEERFGVTWSGGTATFTRIANSVTANLRASVWDMAGIFAAGSSAAITGTITASVDEDDITTGGKTIVITLTGDTFAAAGTGPIGSTADTQALIDGFDAASSPTNGWNNEVRDKALTSEVVRTSSTVATWTVAAQAGYDISSQETITGTIPAAVLVTGASPIVATPTFTIDPVTSGRIMGSIAGLGGLAGLGGIAGKGGGMAG